MASRRAGSTPIPGWSFNRWRPECAAGCHLKLTEFTNAAYRSARRMQMGRNMAAPFVWRVMSGNPAPGRKPAISIDRPGPVVHTGRLFSVGGVAAVAKEYESQWVRGVMTIAGYESTGHGAGEGNRTLVCSLGSCRSTIELHPRRLEVYAIGSAMPRRQLLAIAGRAVFSFAGSDASCACVLAPARWQVSPLD